MGKRERENSRDDVETRFPFLLLEEADRSGERKEGKGERIDDAKAHFLFS